MGLFYWMDQTMIVNVTQTSIPEVLVIETNVYQDHRGTFSEVFNLRDFRKATDINLDFVQHNEVKSSHGVIRGLHYQFKHPQGKLVRCTVGEVVDIAVDMRKGPTLGQYVAVPLRADDNQHVWVPPGFAHAVITTSEYSVCDYKLTDHHYPDDEYSLIWNDPTVAIAWPQVREYILGPKDAEKAKKFQDLPHFG